MNIFRNLRFDRNYFIVSGIGIIGVALLLLAFSIIHSADSHERQIKFDGEAENRYAALKREIESDLQVLTSIQAFYISSKNIDRSTFRAFTKHFLSRHPSI